MFNSREGVHDDVIQLVAFHEESIVTVYGVDDVIVCMWNVIDHPFVALRREKNVATDGNDQRLCSDFLEGVFVAATSSPDVVRIHDL